MRLTIIAVGKKEPAWVNQACDTYLKRLPAPLRPSLLVLPSAKGANAKHQEGLSIMAKIPSGNSVIAMDELGESWDTKMLAENMNNWMVASRDTTFLIGGADGLDADCTATADTLWSLSPLTLPHTIARIVLLEQLYRAWSMLQNHPYHRE